jgi:hypothetical protein
VSRLWKSELLSVQLGSWHCTATVLRRRGLRWDTVGQARAEGQGREALESALAALALRQTGDAPSLPSGARIELDDEVVHYSLRPVSGRWNTVQDRAREQLGDVLGHTGWHLGHTLACGGSHWLVMAAEMSLVDPVTALLRERGIATESIVGALGQDLDRAHAVLSGLPQWPRWLAVVREHGVHLLEFAAGRAHWVGLGWHRLDWRDPQALLSRLDALSQGEPGVLLPALSSREATLSARSALAEPARQRQWLLLEAALPAAVNLEGTPA